SKPSRITTIAHSAIVRTCCGDISELDISELGDGKAPKYTRPHFSAMPPPRTAVLVALDDALTFPLVARSPGAAGQERSPSLVAYDDSVAMPSAPGRLPGARGAAPRAARPKLCKRRG